MSLIIGIILVIALALLFGWLAVHAGRSQRAIVRWPGIAVSGLLLTLCAFIGVTALLGFYRLRVSHDNPVPDVQVAGSPEQIARGERLANLCVQCHSSTGGLPLDGNPENIVEGIGTVSGVNLTPAGPIEDWSDGEIIRAIREGLDESGQALLIMPSEYLHNMSDADAQAIVAYLRTQPPIESQIPESQMNLLGAVVVGLGVFPTSAQPPVTSVEAPPAGPTPEYGEYLAAVSGCQQCHGEGLRGSSGGFVPAGPNLPAIVSGWSADEFVETLRTGVNPSGNSLDTETMPWQNFSAAYTDEELRALYEYIRVLPPRVEPPG